MGTFFEKLTSPRPHGIKHSAHDPILAKEEVSHQMKKHEESKSTRLKVAADSQDEKEEEAVESEDGELTVDIYDKGEAIIIQSTVAGVKPEDLDISITNDSVTIRGGRERHEEVEEKDYYYKELFWGTFSRSVILPEEIDEDAAEASLKHGLLMIRLPKKRKGTVQKLKVKVS